MGVPSDANLNTMGKLNRIEEIIITQIQIMRTIHSDFTRKLTDTQLKMMHPFQHNKHMPNKLTQHAGSEMQKGMQAQSHEPK